MAMEQPIKLELSRRNLVRLVSGLLAVLILLGAWAVAGYRRANHYRALLEDSYSQSLTGLASDLSAISAALQKGRYVSSPVQISYLAARLWKDASAAKTALGNLPLGDLHLDQTNQFLSQVGDYAMSLSRKAVSGGEITQEERDQFARLCEYGMSLAEQLYGMEQSIIEQGVTMESIQEDIRRMESQEEPEPQAETQAGAFQALEDSLADYPEMIYDGPFSDHVSQKEPLMLANAVDTAPQEALELAAKGLGVEPSQLGQTGEEDSQIPSYSFSGDGLWAGVTKKGGYLSYTMKSRLPQEQLIEPAGAIQAAREYLWRMGFAGLTATYYQLSNYVCTIQFAAMQNDAVIYPDLIQVQVAMDNGEILGFDGRGYLTNHTVRELSAPVLSQAEARELVSPALTVESGRLAVIPTAGQNEVLCYEFTARTQEEEKALVYINAASGVEEQLFLFTEGQYGMMIL